MYVTAVLPVLTYGCLVCWHAIISRALMSKLTVVQRAVSLLIIRPLKSTSQSALGVLLNFQSLDILLQFQILVIRKPAEMITELYSSITGQVTIHIDSRTTLKAIKSSTFKLRATLDCKETLLETHGLIKVRYPKFQTWLEGNSLDILQQRGLVDCN